MSYSRYQLEVNADKAKQYSEASLDKAKAVLTTLTTKIATMEDRDAIAEVKKAYTELKAIKSDLYTQTQKLFAGLPVSLMSGSQVMHDISYNQKLIDQRLAALYWIERGSDLVNNLEQGKTTLNELDRRRDWDFERIKREDTWFDQLHHTRIPAREGGEIINALLSRVSERVNEAAEDAAMLMEVRKLNAKAEEEKQAKIKAAAEEAKAKEEAEKRATPAGKAAEAAAQDKAVMGAISGCVGNIEKVLNTAGFNASKKVGIFGRSALDKQADEIRSLCIQAKSSIKKGFITQALSELNKAAELLNQPTKTFFGKKDPPYKAGVFAALDELQKALPERHVSKLTYVPDQQSVLQSQVRRVSRGTSTGG